MRLSFASFLSQVKFPSGVFLAFGLVLSSQLAAAAAQNAEVISFSPNGNDRLYGVAYDQSGSFYAVGSFAEGPDSKTLIAKFKADGSRDASFANGGFLALNLIAAGDAEVARNILIDSQGRLVVAGALEELGTADARDRDLFVVRVLPDGRLDESFAQRGVAILNLAPSSTQGGLYLADTLGGISFDAAGRILVHAAQGREGVQDNDFVLLRLGEDGQLDSSFGQGGKAVFDFDQLGASPKAALVLGDGSILGTGYTRQNGVVLPVVYKVDAQGSLDLSYGKNGRFMEAVLSDTAEIYAVASQGDSIVTVGYGKNAGDRSLDFLSMRINADGQLDSSYGTSGGYTRLDAAGFNDNGRNMTVLPDGRLLLIGGGRVAADNAQAMVAVLDANGIPDESFAPRGTQLFDLGGAGDFFWGVAVAPDASNVVAVGIKGVPAPAGSDDAAVVLLNSLVK